MISIIIPVFNEAAAIRKTLRALPFGRDIEVIIVDGMSTDQTVSVAKKFAVTVITSARGRALQMNAGAAEASGDIFLFLHADCLIEETSLRMLREQVRDNVVGGCFTHTIDSQRIIFRLIEFSGNVRAKVFGIFYGDQAIFVRRDIFNRLHGFESAPIFEDAIFSRRLRQCGKTIVLKEKAVVSPRRWEKGGVVKTTLLNWALTLGFMAGVSTANLAKLYKDIR